MNLSKSSSVRIFSYALAKILWRFLNLNRLTMLLKKFEGSNFTSELKFSINFCNKFFLFGSFVDSRKDYLKLLFLISSIRSLSLKIFEWFFEGTTLTKLWVKCDLRICCVYGLTIIPPITVRALIKPPATPKRSNIVGVFRFI